MRRRSSRCAVASRDLDSLMSSTWRASSARSATLSISVAASCATASTSARCDRCGSNSTFAVTVPCRRTSTTCGPGGISRPSDVTQVPPGVG